MKISSRRASATQAFTHEEFKEYTKLTTEVAHTDSVDGGFTYDHKMTPEDSSK